jgi:hypothetical protein
MFYTTTTNTYTMSTTIDMLVARVDTLEKQLALLLKNTPSEDIKTKKESKAKKPKDDIISDDEVEAKKPKKVKKSKDEPSSDDEDKPKKKRGTNGYILFSNANRDNVKAQLSVGDEKPKNTEIMKQLATMWAEVSVEEKAEWTAKAKLANDDA